MIKFNTYRRAVARTCGRRKRCKKHASKYTLLSPWKIDLNIATVTFKVMFIEHEQAETWAMDVSEISDILILLICCIYSSTVINDILSMRNESVNT